ncbi:hypothetical protein EDB92DRAFT_1855560, partial [Lactarius akahatsu]
IGALRSVPFIGPTLSGMCFFFFFSKVVSTLVMRTQPSPKRGEGLQPRRHPHPQQRNAKCKNDACFQAFTDHGFHWHGADHPQGIAASLPQAEDHQERKHVFVQCDAMASRALQTEDGDGDGGIRNTFQMHAAESA